MQRLLFRLSPLVLATATLLSLPTLAQQNVEFRGNIPVAPTGIANQKLAAGPWTYATAEGMNIKVEVAARGIEYPMALTFLPDGDMLVVSRPGKMHKVHNGQLTEITGGPPSVYFGISGEPSVSHGYIDIALHPDFATNKLVYLAYSKPLGGDNQRSLAIGRGRLEGNTIKDFKDIWGGDNAAVSGAARIAFGLDKTLYIATSGRDPQDLSTAGGKTLHINDDGTIPSNNPFAKTANARPDLYSYGHRSTLGLAVHPTTGALWQNENGPNGGDEVNMIEPGKNYGWPLVSLGRDYSGPWQSNGPNHTGYQGPVVYWMPAIAVSGMAFYNSDVMPKWKGSLFVGSLRTGEIPGTGHIERVVLNEKYEEFRRETLLVDLHQRMRDVKQGPDGFLYVATEEKDGVVLRISPL